jgi:NAD(P)-dependent dehydrogenase (short-subunit alcohol dehydrogenase family)
MPDLTGKRVLILGAETEIGRAVTTAVAEADASVAAVAATSDAEGAFAVQRLARRLSSGERKVIAQAIDATNEAAVRVMVRQVSKELGGMDAAVFCADVGDATFDAMRLVRRSAGRELKRGGGGTVVLAPPDLEGGTFELVRVEIGDDDGDVGAVGNARIVNISVADRPFDDVVVDILSAIAGEADSG